VESGEIDPARLARWVKLATEERFNSASLAQRKSGEKSFQKMINTVQQKNRKPKK
jgi:ribosome biogenesis GTPase